MILPREVIRSAVQSRMHGNLVRRTRCVSLFVVDRRLLTDEDCTSMKPFTIEELSPG